MKYLNEWVYVSQEEKAYVNFEDSLNVDQVAAGYVPVKSTLEVFEFLRDALMLNSPKGRGVVCHGIYGTGKSRLCTVLARIFRDGFDCSALQPVWGRLNARQQSSRIEALKQSLVPTGKKWRPWLVIPLYANGGGGSLSTAFVRGLLKALRREGLNENVLGKTIFSVAAARLKELLSKGKVYKSSHGSHFGTSEQMVRALTDDFDEQALEEFRQWHLRETVTDFDQFLIGSGGAYQAHEIYPIVAERLQQHGYEGIFVLWDEFGLALESLLKGAKGGTRDLPLEAMELQQFLEHACGNNDLGKRVIFLAFTHLSLAEYGQRSELSGTDSDRLLTVAARFRQPSISIKLSVTEMEGYHLLAGMLHRTPQGTVIFENPLPKLQRIATRMPQERFWNNFSSDICYQDIVSPCYPLHPATAATLLVLSDRIAQVNRTAFYYLQSREEGGVASALERTILPEIMEAGALELIRVPELALFFAEPLREKEKQFVNQYEQVVSRLPNISKMESSILQSILILSATKSPDLAPTTSFLSFCLCDAQPEEVSAKPLHDSLTRLREANALWKNDMTEVWGFVTDSGLGQDLEKELDLEKSNIRTGSSISELLANNLGLREEITDRLGEFDLDPCDAGIVRRISIQLLDLKKEDNRLSFSNPGLDGINPWLSAVIYLACADTLAALDACRLLANRQAKGQVYMVLPSVPLFLNIENIRDLIAVRNLLDKKDKNTHAYKFLESKLTKLRGCLRLEFSNIFGNEGLRTGTNVLKVGLSPRALAVSSWGQLLPAIAKDLDNDFLNQLRVRCGTYNAWHKGSSGPIKAIVKSILDFENNNECQKEFMGYNKTSQESAIIDGVLVENKFFYEKYPETKTWDLVTAAANSSSEVLNEVYKHFVSASRVEKDFSKLFEKMIEAPFGVPNGILPLLVALVFRKERQNIAIYFGKNNKNVTADDTALTIIQMCQNPSEYKTRFNKLSSRQRWIFRVIGGQLNPAVDVPHSGPIEKIEEMCDKVAFGIREIVKLLPNAAIEIPNLSDLEKDILKVLRGGVPPQPTLLADHLLRWVAGDISGNNELEDHDSKTNLFPATIELWRGLNGLINRQIEGARAPVRTQVAKLGRDSSAVIDSLRSFKDTFDSDSNKFDKIISVIHDKENNEGDFIESITAAIAGKSPKNLTQEDFGRAAGFLEGIQIHTPVLPVIGKLKVVLLDGITRELPVFINEHATHQIQEVMHNLRNELSLSDTEIISLLLRDVFSRAAEEMI